MSFRQKEGSISVDRDSTLVYSNLTHHVRMHCRHSRLIPELNITRALSYGGRDLCAKSPIRMSSVNTSLPVSAEITNTPKEEPLRFRDCAEILRSGATASGIYNIRLPNSSQTVKVVRL